MTNKTITKLYEAINTEAVRLMLEEGMGAEEAFEQAVPKHFHETAVEEDKLPSEFVMQVWKTLNEIQDGGAEKVANGQILIKLQLKADAYRFKVWAALKQLEEKGLVCRPNLKTWSRVKKEAAESGKSAASD